MLPPNTLYPSSFPASFATPDAAPAKATIMMHFTKAIASFADIMFISIIRESTARSPIYLHRKSASIN